MEKKGEVSKFFLVSQSGFFFSRRKKNALSISLLPLSLCLSVFSLCFCVRLLFFVSSPSTMGREEEDYPGAFFAVVVVESIERASSVSATRRSSGRARERESEALDRRRPFCRQTTFLKSRQRSGRSSTTFLVPLALIFFASRACAHRIGGQRNKPFPPLVAESSEARKWKIIEREASVRKTLSGRREPFLPFLASQLLSKTPLNPPPPPPPNRRG